jgi:hypothetical protein
MKVLVTGDREWSWLKPIKSALMGFPPDTIVIHGDCWGADKLADYVGKHLGFEVRPYPADWKAHGKPGGPIRNQKMLDDEEPDIVLAFHGNIRKSKGTLDMCKRARKAGVPVILISTNVYQKTS